MGNRRFPPERKEDPRKEDGQASPIQKVCRRGDIGLAIAILYPPSIVNLVRTLFAWKWLVLLIALYWLARWLIRRNTRR